MDDTNARIEALVHEALKKTYVGAHVLAFCLITRHNANIYETLQLMQRYYETDKEVTQWLAHLREVLPPLLDSYHKNNPR
jgi:hypothetical protein